MTEESIKEFATSKSLITPPGTRDTQDIVYVRYYLIAILYNKFRCTEQEIAEFFNRERSTITYGRRTPYTLRNNKTFLSHTKEVRELFPYDYENPKRERVLSRGIRVTITISEDTYDILNNYQKEYKIKDLGKTLDHIFIKEM